MPSTLDFVHAGHHHWAESAGTVARNYEFLAAFARHWRQQDRVVCFAMYGILSGVIPIMLTK